jgi:thiol-disulfide isomerase/thioredoxin
MLWAETEEDYQKKLAERMAKNPAFVPVKRKPKGLSPAAQFGVNFAFEGHSLSWILDGDEKQGYVMYLDLNANGDLSDDKMLRFERQQSQYSHLFRATVRDVKRDPAQTYPLLLRLEVASMLPTGQAQPRRGIFYHDHTVRRGVIRVGARDVAFRLSGVRGIYDLASSVVYFDLNGDGRLEGAEPTALPGDSPERYPLLDKFISLGETSYEFVVDRYGRSLTLRPLAEKLPPRPVLLSGHPAPDFTFTDLDGKTQKLSDYRGKVVLLNFWGVWCSPCVAAVPKLVEAYEKYGGRGFEIIGIDADDTEETLRKFIAEKKLAWAQTREENSGPIHRLHRVAVWPRYFLVGKDGKIVAAATGGSRMDLMAELEKLLPATEK